MLPRLAEPTPQSSMAPTEDAPTAVDDAPGIRDGDTVNEGKKHSRVRSAQFEASFY